MPLCFNTLVRACVAFLSSIIRCVNVASQVATLNPSERPHVSFDTDTILWVCLQQHERNGTWRNLSRKQRAFIISLLKDLISTFRQTLALKVVTKSQSPSTRLLSTHSSLVPIPLVNPHLPRLLSFVVGTGRRLSPSLSALVVGPHSPTSNTFRCG
jgi:hypothetical protein